MTAWLTPIWFFGLGIAFGLVLLALFVLLVKGLALTPWERLSHGPAGHVVAALLSLGLAGAVGYAMPSHVWGDEKLNEPQLLGIALVLLCAIVGWAVVFCANRQAAKNVWSTIAEGAAAYMMITALVIVLAALAIWSIGLVTTPIVAAPWQALASIPATFTTGEMVIERTIPAAPTEGLSPFYPIDLPIDLDLLYQLEITSSAMVVLGDAEEPADFERAPIQIGPNETISWTRAHQKIEDSPIPHDPEKQLHIQNREIDEAVVTFRALTQPPVPQASSLIMTALATLLIGLAWLLQNAVAPRASAVAHATVKNELAQPLFLVLMLLGSVAILLYEFLSFNTFGEDIKLLKDCGITTIMLLAAFQGVWSASSSISEEIEGKTALTILSKPLQRRSFIIGKFLGIFWVLMLMFLILGALELSAVAYKPIYDARENSLQMPEWDTCHLEMFRTIPGLAMAFMQSTVLTAISVALATRLPQLANLAVCFAIYVVGNLTTSLVSSTQEGFEIVKFVASLVATIIPILEHFSLQAAIDAGNPITMSLLSGNLIYCLLYVLLAMFLALLLFEDRDLA
ncbi:MAG: transporter [Pirellulaceae bacterium]|nr:MAG: transporter [Pirellulaceae bacterium]